MPPEWISDGVEFRHYVFGAHHETVNGSTVGNGGHGVDIGIIDSVFQLPTHIAEDVNTGEAYRFIDTSENQTRIHGFRVQQLAMEFAPDATYHFYQAITEEGKIPIGAYNDAIDQAIEDQVDILNISAGNDWGVPLDADPYAKKPPEAVEEGITVVAAAGNYDGVPPKPPVNTPAALDCVISAGGAVTFCPESPDKIHDTPYEGPYYVSDKVYCGEQGCSGGESCFSNQTREEWEGNPEESRGSIDVLAPTQYPYEAASGGFEMDQGSSFAAPIVTGVLAEAYSDIRAKGGQVPNPETAREVVRQTSIEQSDGLQRLLNGFRVKGTLEDICVPRQSGT